MEHSQMYLEYLTNEGFSPKLMDDGNILFKYEGKIYIIEVYEQDKQYFRLLLPNFFQIENEEERIKALQVANDVNSSIKVGTIIIIKDWAWSVAEIFIDSTPNIEDFFIRVLQIVQDASRRFVKGML